MATSKQPSEGKEELPFERENRGEHANAIDALKASITANKDQSSVEIKTQENPENTETLWRRERQRVMDASSDARLELAGQID